MRSNMMDDEYENVLITPDASPLTSPKNRFTKKQTIGGRYHDRSKEFGKQGTSMRNLAAKKKGDDGSPFEEVVMEDMTEEQYRAIASRFSDIEPVRISTLTERIKVDQHPLAGSPTIKASILQWVSTFKYLPFFPPTMSDLVTSGALYMIMEEIEPDFFPELSVDTLPKGEEMKQLSHTRLRKVYRKMLDGMETWFHQNGDKDTVKKTFKRELIDLQRLYEYQDLNEILIIIEFVMVIVVRG